jgi:diguanylate cyclase (GGDEF)-like protein
MHAPWWILAATIVLVGVGLAVIGGFRADADAEHQTRVRVLELDQLVTHVEADEWEFRATREFGSEEAVEIRGDLRETERLARIIGGKHSRAGRDVVRSAAEYVGAVRRVTALMAAGRWDAAVEIDERELDPAADALDEVLSGYAADAQRAADGAQRRADVMTAASVVGLAMALVLLYLRMGQRERREAAARAADLEHLASHDSLTGLPNRRALQRDLEPVGASSPARLALFDLDGFKAYNDAFGHPEGDELLRRLGRRLAVAVADSGRAYRLGGDEFCVLVPLAGDDDRSDADALVRRCAHALHEQGPSFGLHEQGPTFDIRTSFGVVDLPAEAPDGSAALQLADQRLYGHKGGSRSSARQQVRDVALRILHERHPELHDHATGVADLARAVGERLGMASDGLGDVVRAAELHDIGKIAVPAAILHKPAPLDEDEWRIMSRHTIVGAHILAAAPAIARVAPLVRASHERWDGRGYPDGLAGEAIPLGARVILACDAFDAMTSPRPYHLPRTHDEALAELQRCAGTQLDPDVVRALLDELRARAATPAAGGAVAA